MCSSGRISSLKLHKSLKTPNVRLFNQSILRYSPLENVLDGGAPLPVQVSKISPAGIELADGLVITSSCIFLGGKVFLWKVPPTLWSGWENDRFEVFEVAIPKPGEPLLTIPRMIDNELFSAALQSSFY